MVRSPIVRGVRGVADENPSPGVAILASTGHAGLQKRGRLLPSESAETLQLGVTVVFGESFAERDASRVKDTSTWTQPARLPESDMCHPMTPPPLYRPTVWLPPGRTGLRQSR